MLPDHEDQDDVIGEQRLQNFVQKESPTGLDMMLQKLMDPAIAPEPINIPEILSHSEAKKQDKENKESSKSKYH